jgi:cytidyltransferase-like protein
MNIWVNGCFDILHTGHLDLLEFAKSLHNNYNKLLVGIDSDRRVKILKGKKRPINGQFERKRFLMSLNCVDQAYIFDSDKELKDFIINHEIDYMVVGDHYRDKEVIGSDLTRYGVVYYPTDKRSSTDLIKKIKKNDNSNRWFRFHRK